MGAGGEWRTCKHELDAACRESASRTRFTIDSRVEGAEIKLKREIGCRRRRKCSYIHSAEHTHVLAGWYFLPSVQPARRRRRRQSVPPTSGAWTLPASTQSISQPTPSFCPILHLLLFYVIFIPADSRIDRTVHTLSRSFDEFYLAPSLSLSVLSFLAFVPRTNFYLLVLILICHRAKRASELY